MPEAIPTYVRQMTCTKATSAVTYHFSPITHEALAGWALATVNDNTGELTIQSDWGNWSNRWSPDPKHLGQPTLSHFIATRGHAHYLADKLTRREEREHFDAAATVKSMQRQLCRMRLEDGRLSYPNYHKVWCRFLHKHEQWLLEPDNTRRIYDELDELRGEDNVDRFIEAFFRISGHDIISDEPWHSEHLKYTPSCGYMQLLHGILPALIAACRVRIARIETV